VRVGRACVGSGFSPKPLHFIVLAATHFSRAPPERPVRPSFNELVVARTEMVRSPCRFAPTFALEIRRNGAAGMKARPYVIEI
jgi:hypothetical protein